MRRNYLCAKIEHWFNIADALFFLINMIDNGVIFLRYDGGEKYGQVNRDKKLREDMKMKRREFCDYYDIPYRTVRDWKVIETCLKEYIGKCVEIIETADNIYISTDFPGEYAGAKDKKELRGANLHAKGNASCVIEELVQIATGKCYSENYAGKHKKDAMYGWYRYDTRFALPIYNNEGELERYNIFKARLLVRHAEDGKMYLYDILRTKKETSKPL